MKVAITRFVCDTCSKAISDQVGFPYGLGWYYLYNLNFQAPKTVDGVGSGVPLRVSLHDKHFCSVICMLSFIDKAVSKAVVDCVAIKTMSKDDIYPSEEGGYDDIYPF